MRNRFLREAYVPNGIDEAIQTFLEDRVKLEDVQRLIEANLVRATQLARRKRLVQRLLRRLAELRSEMFV